MDRKPNLLAMPEAWDVVADGYAETTMQILAMYAEDAISVAEPGAGESVLDVACGPGTVSLMLTKQVKSVHSIDFSQPMVSILKQKINETGLQNIYPQHGDGQALPYKSNTFDAVFSLFGLMFFPNRSKGYSEIYRTLKPDGRIVVSSWAPVDQSPALLTMFGALKTIKPDLPEHETAMKSLENPDQFEKELCEAGFRDVRIQRMTKHFPVESVQEFWHAMVRGSAPIIMMKKSMGEDLWREKEQLALAYLENKLPETPTSLSSDAWLGTGVK